MSTRKLFSRLPRTDSVVDRNECFGNQKSNGIGLRKRSIACVFVSTNQNQTKTKKPNVLPSINYTSSLPFFELGMFREKSY